MVRYRPRGPAVPPPPSSRVAVLALPEDWLFLLLPLPGSLCSPCQRTRCSPSFLFQGRCARPPRGLAVPPPSSSRVAVLALDAACFYRNTGQLKGIARFYAESVQRDALLATVVSGATYWPLPGSAPRLRSGRVAVVSLARFFVIKIVCFAVIIALFLS